MKFLVVIWAAAVIAGGLLLLHYDSTPAKAHVAIDTWPLATTLRRETSKPTMIIALHPECSCTRATLAELRRMQPAIKGKAKVSALLLGEHVNRYRSEVDSMEIEAYRDPTGAEAKRFGLTTSGEVSIFSPSGQLLYSGGLTGARGREGDNAGEDAALAAILSGSTAPQKRAPVFGCGLLNENQ